MTKTKIEQPQSVSGAFDELLNKMYISNVQNRLRQLNEPTENDCKRWVWELIQNAKDSITQDDSRDKVDIKLTVRDKSVKFSHNGSPFTAKAQLGLLYKYSEGKVNNSESTGRFGTGFLTTHTLSKIVTIEGDVFTEDTNNPLCGFSATMYRDGLDEDELLDGVKKMKESMVYTKETNEWTTYTYHLKTPQNENALKLGLENFISNIAQTMLFCSELNSVKLDDNGIVTRIVRTKENELINGNIYLSEFEIIGAKTYKRRFVHKSIEKYSEDLSKRFKTDRSIKLTAAIEIDDKSNIVENEESPSHYCVLPLVGSEKHILPVYLNSPDFEPDSERESLILIGDDILSDKGVISEGGINRLILKESIELYDALVSHLTKSSLYRNLFLLAKGLKKLPKFEKNFNKEWFEETIITGFRKALIKYPVVETSTGNQKLFFEDGMPRIIIPKDSKLENQIEIYELSKSLFENRLPLPDNISEKWAVLAWKECGLFKIENLCEYISERKNIDNIPLSTDKLIWLNRFLKFVSEIDEGLLKTFALVPNSNCDLVSLGNEDFSEGVNINEFSISTLFNLGEDLKPNLLHPDINQITLPVKIDSKKIAEKINEQAQLIIENKDLTTEDRIKSLIPIIQIIPTNEHKYKAEFIKKQNKVNEFTRALYVNLPISRNEDNNIESKAWQETHNWLIIQLMQLVCDYGNINALPENITNKTEWVNSFISFVSKEIKEGTLDEISIIPNQNNDFKLKKELSRDISIPEELKTERAEKFGINLKKDLLNKEIETIEIAQEKDINSVVTIINNLFDKNEFAENEDDLDFAIYLSHFLPEEKSQVLHSYQKTLLNLVQKYYYGKIKSYSPTVISCNVEDFWRKTNDKIVKSLVKDISVYGSLSSLKEFLSKSGAIYDEGDTIILLNDFYDYLKSSNRNLSGNIIPNQNGDFCSLDDDFFRDDNIPDELKDILALVNPAKDCRTILAEKSLSLSAQPIHSKSVGFIIDLIDKEVNEMYKGGPSNWENENFKEAINLLMIEWFPKYKDLAKRFERIYKKKETIEMNVLWSLEERQRMQKARSIDPELLDKFIEKNGEIESLEEEKKKLEEEIEALKNSEQNNVSSEILKEFPDITPDKIRELLKLEERVKGWNGASEYQPESEAEERRNYENGYKGEAYIYSQLKKSGQFKNIIWEHKSEVPTDIQIEDYEGETHFIKENYSRFDLFVETNEGAKIYIEVKSTRTSLADADTIALPISSREWKYVNQISENDKYYLARVFNVENNPEGHYLSLMGIEIAKNYNYSP